MTESDRDHWVFDKKVNVGHLLTTAMLAGSIFLWGNSMDKRVAVLEEKARAQSERDAQQDSNVQSSVLLLRNEFVELRNEIRETNRNLNRLLEGRKAAP